MIAKLCKNGLTGVSSSAMHYMLSAPPYVPSAPLSSVPDLIILRCHLVAQHWANLSMGRLVAGTRGDATLLGMQACLANGRLKGICMLSGERVVMGTGWACAAQYCWSISCSSLLRNSICRDRSSGLDGCGCDRRGGGRDS